MSDKKANKFFNFLKEKNPLMLISVFTILIGFSYYLYKGVILTDTEKINYSEVIPTLENKSIDNINLKSQDDGSYVISLIDKEKGSSKVKVYKGITTLSDKRMSELEKAAKKKNVEIKFIGPNLFFAFLNLAFSALPFVFLYFIFKPMMGDFLQKKNGLVDLEAEDIKGINFDSVIGLENEKEELSLICDYVENIEHYRDGDITIPKGILLTGPPGGGKTLLAKALAGESNMNFYSFTGNDFSSSYYGKSKKMIEAVFKEARENSPSIIFIDEIDSIAGKRTAATGSNSAIIGETNSIVNQLLVELDGFDSLNDVFVIGTTNFADSLDPALLRSGRLEKQIFISPPALNARKELLEFYSKDIDIDESVNLNHFAKLMTGFVGADIKFIIDQAKLLAFRDKRSVVTTEDIEEAYSQKVAGIKRANVYYSERDKEIIAYHESGHAIIGYMLGNKTVNQVNIIPRGKFGGFAAFAEKEDKFIELKSDLLNDIIVSLGGRAAEEIFSNTQSSGVFSDIQSATEIATTMVTKVGMSDEIGLRFVPDGDYGIDNEDVINAIDNILNDSYEESKRILRENKDLVEAMKNELIKSEILNADEIESLIQKTLDLRN